MCGRLRGYQVGTTDGFGPYQNDQDSDQVVDGILISHGETQEHIWAYATACRCNRTIYFKEHALPMPS